MSLFRAMLLLFVGLAMAESCPPPGYYRTSPGYVNGGSSGGIYMPPESFHRVMRIDTLCHYEFQSVSSRGFMATIYREQGVLKAEAGGDLALAKMDCGITKVESCNNTEETTHMVLEAQGFRLGEASYDRLEGKDADSVASLMNLGPQRANKYSRFMVVICVLTLIGVLLAWNSAD